MYANLILFVMVLALVGLLWKAQAEFTALAAWLNRSYSYLLDRHDEERHEGGARS